MTTRFGEIFNDVLAPILIGPSSSHTAGPAKIGKIIHDIVGKAKSCVFEMSTSGSFPKTYKGHGSDFGYCGGLLGMMADDEQLSSSLDMAKQQGVDVQFTFVDEPFDHPNRVIARVVDANDKQYIIESKSVGGGYIEVDKINGVECHMHGDKYALYNIADNSITEYDSMVQATEGSRLIMPVTAVVTKYKYDLPFYDAATLLQYLSKNGGDILSATLEYEKSIAGIDSTEVYRLAGRVWDTMKNSAKQGLCSDSDKGFTVIKPCASKMENARKEGRFINTGDINKATTIAVAVMEQNRRSGKVVACPTAGSAGVVPATLISQLDNFDEKTVVDALLIAGMIGVFIFGQATFGAEEAGCQAENGSASVMACSALAYLYGGTAQQILSSASVAMQNVLGMICDPVNGGVEIPCISKNVMAVANAYVSANMVLNGYDAFIPLDQSICAMKRVGEIMPSEHLCTCNGGLAICDVCKGL